jgi:ABC-type phosphate transport system permease subunit
MVMRTTWDSLRLIPAPLREVAMALGAPKSKRSCQAGASHCR